MTLQYFLLPYLEAFHRQHPEIRIRITNNPTPQTVQALLADQIDLRWSATRCPPIRRALYAGARDPRHSGVQWYTASADVQAR